jgi:hypothetical protein
LAFLNQGADLAAVDGLWSARHSRGAFLTLGGNWSRYHTGSHVDVEGLSLLAGFGRTEKMQYGTSVFAPFFEAGWGGYNAWNNFSGGDIIADGDIGYYGGGVLTRHNFRSGMYVDASFRAGRVSTDYASADLSHIVGHTVSYEADSAYVGTHVGLGRVWNLSSRRSLDLYGKYFYLHETGAAVNVAGALFRFDAMNSHRLRLGGRMSHVVNSRFNAYYGAAWEHEFSGAARASVYGYAIDVPGLRGGTGLGELGLRWAMPLSQRCDPCGALGFALPLSFDLGLQGYMGKREGVSGSLLVRYEF